MDLLSEIKNRHDLKARPNGRSRYLLSNIMSANKDHRKVIISLFVLAAVFSCSGLSVKEKSDDLGRIVRKTTYIDGNVDSQEEIRYKDDTEKPVLKVHKKLRGDKVVPEWFELFTYENDQIDQIKIFIIANNKQILSGKIVYKYHIGKLKKIEYYSIPGIKNLKLNRHGLDLYNYRDGSLSQRRIIEYEYNPTTGKSMQISQYVVHFRDNSIQSMETWMLEKKSRKILKNKEININIILEMISNIEKSQRERCKGTRLIEK